MRLLSDRAEVLRACEVLFGAGQVVELRALECRSAGWRKPHTVAGYFNDWEKLASAAAGLDAARGLRDVEPGAARTAGAVREPRDGRGREGSAGERPGCDRAAVAADRLRPGAAAGDFGVGGGAHPGAAAGARDSGDLGETAVAGAGAGGFGEWGAFAVPGGSAPGSGPRGWARRRRAWRRSPGDSTTRG